MWLPIKCKTVQTFWLPNIAKNDSNICLSYLFIIILSCKFVIISSYTVKHSSYLSRRYNISAFTYLIFREGLIFLNPRYEVLDKGYNFRNKWIWCSRHITRADRFGLLRGRFGILIFGFCMLYSSHFESWLSFLTAEIPFSHRIAKYLVVSDLLYL